MMITNISCINIEFYESDSKFELGENGVESISINATKNEIEIHFDKDSTLKDIIIPINVLKSYNYKQL